MQEGPQTEVSGSSVKVAFSASLALRVYLILEAVSNPGGKGSLNVKGQRICRWPGGRCPSVRCPVISLTPTSLNLVEPYLPLGVGAVHSTSSNLQLQEEVPTGLANLAPPPPPVWAEGFLSLVITVNKIC